MLEHVPVYASKKVGPAPNRRAFDRHLSCHNQVVNLRVAFGELCVFHVVRCTQVALARETSKPCAVLYVLEVTMSQAMSSRPAAEFLGTGVPVFGGCGSAIFSAKVVASNTINMGIGFPGVALAFGLTVPVMVYAVGHIFGGHFSPAVTLGAALAGRIEWKSVPAYTVTQVAGPRSPAWHSLPLRAACMASIQRPRASLPTDMRAALPTVTASSLHCWQRSSSSQSSCSSFLDPPDKRAPKGLAGVSIDLSLTLFRLVSSPSPTPRSTLHVPLTWHGSRALLYRGGDVAIAFHGVGWRRALKHPAPDLV